MALYTLDTGLLLQCAQLDKDTLDSKRSWGLFLSGDARTALQHLSSVSALCASSSPRLKSHPFAFLHLCSHTTASPLLSCSCLSFFALFFIYLFLSVSLCLLVFPCSVLKVFCPLGLVLPTLISFTCVQLVLWPSVTSSQSPQCLSLGFEFLVL